MINCAIVDDEEHALEVLMHHVSQCDMLSLVAATTNPTEALSLVTAGSIDLLFLDIHMPKISGIDVARIIAPMCKVIFTTAYPEYAIEGYELGVEDYLLKPVSYPRFLKAVHKAAERIGAKDLIQPDAGTESPCIYVKTGQKNSVIKINLDEIVYIESLQNYAGIYHCGKKTLAYLTLKELEAALPLNSFLRVHKSYVVSLAKIARVEGNEILLEDRTRISIGESYRAKFWEVIKKDILG